MLRLPERAPRIYQAFLQGQFVVKRTPGKFKAVAADQSLEQTINGSQKVVVVSLVVQERKTLLLNGR